jgi:glycosyltransferase involved in cell wall biosynthesis
MSSLRVLHITPLIGSRAGGLASVAVGLVSVQRSLGHQSDIRCVDSPEEAARVEAASGLSGAVTCDPYVGPASLAYSPAGERWAASTAAHDYQVVHQHGIWPAHSRVTLRWARTTGGPVVLAPQGTLEPYPLSRSRWKKALALAAWERANLHQASCLYATAESEALGFRRYGLRNPVAVIPNGVPETWLDAAGDGARFRARHGLDDGRRIMLFLSRIHPKKGLPLLLEAMASLRGALEDWVLVVAGPDEVGHTAEMRDRAAVLGVGHQVRFVGPAYGTDKEDAFAASELFVLPTLSDNFAIAVTEALGAGVPVLTTHGAPWSDLPAHGCGWWVPVTVPALAEALADAAGRDAAGLAEMGRRGRALVAERYTWERVGRGSLELYAWLLGQAERPDFVMVD